MIRNLDLGTLRSLLAIDETGGVTRAANRLHLTQSAVSMQVKRLEDTLSVKVIERDGKRVRMTLEGERLVEAARQIVALNDQVVQRLTTPLFEGELSVGVPHDIVHPHLPYVLRRFGREYPRVSVKFATDFTVALKRGLREGRYDIILGTEARPSQGGVTLAERSLLWSGALDGRVWRQRPLPLSFCRNCIFRKPALVALGKADIAHVEIVDTQSDDAAMVAIAADLAVGADLSGARLQGVAAIEHDNELPELGVYCITRYIGKGKSRELAGIFGAMLAERYGEN